MVDCTTNGYAHHRPVPPWTARTGRRDIARGRTYSRLGRGPGGVTDLHAARPTRGGHHCREVPRKDDTTATFSLRLERAKWAEIFFRLMDGILNMHDGPRGEGPHCALPAVVCCAVLCWQCCHSVAVPLRCGRGHYWQHPIRVRRR
eukprot:COSAG01_NODE_1740_length_9359_cov_6.376998_4_plen_146_part_00